MINSKFQEQIQKGVVGVIKDRLIPVNDPEHPIDLPEDHNIIVWNFNKIIPAILMSTYPAYNFWFAVGTGRSYWDNGLPDENANIERTALENEIARVRCSLRFLDPVTELPVLEPTNVLEMKAIFLNQVGNGELREFAIFSGDATDVVGSGTAINWKPHEKITKTELYNLERRFQLWFLVNYDILTNQGA